MERAQRLFLQKLKLNYRVDKKTAEKLWADGFDTETNLFQNTECRGIRHLQFAFTDDSFDQAHQLYNEKQLKKTKVYKAFEALLQARNDEDLAMVSWVKGELFVIYLAPQATALNELPASACVSYNADFNCHTVVAPVADFLYFYEYKEYKGPAEEQGLE